MPAAFDFDRDRRGRGALDFGPNRSKHGDVDALPSSAAGDVRPDLELASDNAATNAEVVLQTALQPGRQLLLILRRGLAPGVPELPRGWRRALLKALFDAAQRCHERLLEMRVGEDDARVVALREHDHLARLGRRPPGQSGLTRLGLP